MTWTLHEGDCLAVMPTLPDHSIDMILCDLPYGTTACKWDTIIPFEPLWTQYKRLIKPRGAIVLTASQPFTSMLVMSNPKWFRYEWIWEKEQGTNFLDARRKPYKVHENVCVFAEKLPLYMPLYTTGPAYVNGRHRGSEVYGKFNDKQELKTHGRLPRSIQKFNREVGLHPTQKPVALFEYLIRTYTNEGDTILDNCAGSGTTGAAAERCGRHSVMIEREPKYCEIIRSRMAALTGGLFVAEA